MKPKNIQFLQHSSKIDTDIKHVRISCLRLLLLLAGCQSSAAQQEESPTTFILVRHAEKAADGTKNPPLTAQGRQRAEALATLLEEI